MPPEFPRGPALTSGAVVTRNHGGRKLPCGWWTSRLSRRIHHASVGDMRRVVIDVLATLARSGRIGSPKFYPLSKRLPAGGCMGLATGAKAAPDVRSRLNRTYTGTSATGECLWSHGLAGWISSTLRAET